MGRLYGSVSLDVDVDLDEIYDSMSRHQRNSFVEKLQDDGYIEDCECVEDDDFALSEGILRIKNEDWNSECVRLSNLYYNLSEEDIQTIKGIIKKHI